MWVCPKCSQTGRGDSRICRACGAILERTAEPDVEIVDATPVESDHPPGEKPWQPPRKSRPPLGLPSGSIRALLTLQIVAVVVVQILRGQDVELLWTETLMIALAHYFTSRRLLNLSPDVLRRLAAEGQIDPESNPLFLPRHSIRALVIMAFVGVTFYLFQNQLLWESPALPLLGVVFAYLLGIVARAKFRGAEDLKAVVVLAVLGYAAVAYLAGFPRWVPDPLRNATLAMVLFYFGSR